MRYLLDPDGEFTRLATGLRIIALVVAIISGLALALLTPIALLAPMDCGGGGCTDEERIIAAGQLYSPLLWLISTVSGAFAFSRPSWPLIALAIVPAIIAGIFWSFVPL